MPSGYTHDIYEGTPITFEQFALKCARGMGAAIHQRDDNSDAEITERTLDDYYLNSATEAEAAIAEALSRSDDEWSKLQAEEIDAAEIYRAEYIAKRAGMRKRYKAMLTQVDAWEPPTQEHEGFKEFMFQQITESMTFDSGGSYEPRVPEPLSVAEYRAAQIAKLAKAHADRVKSLEEERERVRSQNEWVRALRDSLNPTKEAS